MGQFCSRHVLIQNKLMFLLKVIYDERLLSGQTLIFRPHAGTPEDGRVIEVQP